jgi:hypothetical protein
MDIQNINQFAKSIQRDIEDYEFKTKLVDISKHNKGYDKSDLKDMKNDINNNKQQLNLMIEKYLQNLNLENV